MTDPDQAAARLRRQLADRLCEAGHLKSASWRAAVEAVPRHKFLSGGCFRAVPGSVPTCYAPVLPDESGEGWLSLCYSDESLVTQIAGTIVPRDITGTIARQPSSSSTLPSLMVDMLEALDVADGHSVLEIGTGTGYHTGLLAHRVGAERVTTVETDHGVAANGEPAGDYFLHPASGSFAVVSPPADGGYRVRQGGPVRIWDAVERAVADWREGGSPSVTAFRVRVTPEAQEVYAAAAPGAPDPVKG